YTTTYVNSTTLTVSAIPGTQFANPGNHPVQVTDTTTSTPGTSNIINYVVTTPTPTVTSVSPSTVGTSASPVSVTLTGTNFFSNTIVKINGVAIPAANVTYVNSTTLTVSIPAANLASPGTLNL